MREEEERRIQKGKEYNSFFFLIWRAQKFFNKKLDDVSFRKLVLFREREKDVYIYINLISFVQRKTCNARQENSLGKNMDKNDETKMWSRNVTGQRLKVLISPVIFFQNIPWLD